MSKTPPGGGEGADGGNDARLGALLDEVSARSLPPVHAWHPTRRGDIDIRIARDGEWFYQGSRIDRPRMVHLFSTVLRVDDEGTWLVTPEQMLRIVVEDAPFTAAGLEVHGRGESQVLSFTTNVGEPVVVDAQHPIRVDYAHANAAPAPYVRVRDRLDALILRQCFIDLAGLAEVRGEQAGVLSSGHFMVLGPAGEG